MAARDDIDALLEDYEPQVRREFLDSIRGVVDETILADVADRLEAGDLEGAVAAVDAPSATFNALSAVAVASAFAAAGLALVTKLPRMRTRDGLRLVPRFDSRSNRSRVWLDARESALTTRLSYEVRTVARETLSEGISAGRRPRELALDLVGRLSRARGRREGGTVGLTSQQAAATRAARDELTNGGTPGMRAYLGRRLRDQRLDRMVLRAVEAETPLSAEDVNRLVGRYSSNMLDFRADVFAHDEVKASLHAGQLEAIRQIVETGAASPDMVRKTWRTTGDARVRNSHAYLDGRTVGMDDSFRTVGGGLLYPGDRSLGASVGEIAGCRCHVVYRLNFQSATGDVRRRRVG